MIPAKFAALLWVFFGGSLGSSVHFLHGGDCWRFGWGLVLGVRPQCRVPKGELTLSSLRTQRSNPHGDAETAGLALKPQHLLTPPRQNAAHRLGLIAVKF